ncbi:MAG: carboxypeptidase regulatory-like domain-containing protein [Granulosicoccus sp.]
MEDLHQRTFKRPGIHLPGCWLVATACLSVLTILASTTHAGSSQARLELLTRDTGGNALEHVVASLHPRGKPGTAVSNDTISIMDQRDLQFAPTVLAVQVGSKVTFPNEDDVRHHVYSFSHPNAFELKLYHGETGAHQVFQHEGVVVLGCNIHDGMLGYVRVVDTPYFATSNADGEIAMSELPPGNYELQVWHPDIGMKVVRKSFTLKPGSSRLEMKVAVDQFNVPPPKDPHPLQSLFRD